MSGVPADSTQQRPAKAMRRARVLSVRRHWPHHAWMADGRVRHRWDASRFVMLAALAMLLAASLFDAVALYGWRPAGDLCVLARPAPAVLAALLLVNAWLLERVLRRHTPAHLRPTRVCLWVRRVIAAVPVVGLLAVPAWRRLVARRPRWAFTTLDAPRLSPTAPVRRQRAWRQVERWLDARAQSLPWLGLWMVSCQALPALALIRACVDAAAAPSMRPTLRATLGLALHVVAALLTSSYTALHLRRHPSGPVQARLLWALGLAPLLPFPGCLPTMLAWAWIDRENPERRAAVALPWRRRGLQRVPAALQAGTLRGTRSRGMGYDERTRRSLYRLKTAALVVDLGALAWLYDRFIAHERGAKHESWWTMPLIVVVVSLATIVVLRLRNFALERRAVLLRPVSPLARFLALGRLASLPGVFLGFGTVHGDGQVVAAALAGFGLLAVFVTMFSGVLAELKDQATRTWPLFVAWLLLYGVLLYAGLPGLVGPLAPVWRPALVRGCESAFAAAPLVSLLLFVAFGRALLQPFKLRAVFDDTLRWRTRAAVGFVGLTALLPLGGLAVPAWVHLRAHHWPRPARTRMGRCDAARAS
jgi:hypothetical protein